MKRFLFVLIAVIVNYQLHVESLYCYVCTEANPACADPPNVEALRWNLEACNGVCVSYVNPNTGLLTRTCSWYIGIMDSRDDFDNSTTTTKTINDVSYDFCVTDGCNLGASGSTSPTTTTTTTTITTTATATATATTTTTTMKTSTTTSIATTTYNICQGLVCQSASTFDYMACTCRCITGTSGASCENIDCNTPDHPSCSMLECDDDPLIKYYCIQKCNTCSTTSSTARTTTPTTSSTTSTTPITTTATTTSTTTTPITTTTTITTTPITTTTTTSTTTTTTTPITTTTTTTTTSATTTTTSTTTTTTTPATTSTTTATTPLTTTTAECNQRNCQNGGIYDSSSCKCSCLASFTGNDCENVECEHPDEDMCEYLECDDAPEVKYYCIQKCNLCDAQNGLSSLSTPFSSTSTTSATTTTPITTTTTTTTTTTSATTSTTTATTPLTTTTAECNQRNCQNGGIYDSSSCKCSCLASFTGNDCENVECEHPDEDMCEYLECDDAPEVKYYCIQKCNLCDAQNGLSSLATPFSSTSTTSATTTTTSTTTTTTTSITTTTTTTTTSSTTSATTTTVFTIPTTLPVTTATISTCKPKLCLNSGIFDTGDCKCNCLPGFSGIDCEKVDCNQKDEDACSYLECDDDEDMKYFCIQKCHPCDALVSETTLTTPTTVTITSVSSSTVASSSTPTTTTESSECNQRNCQNGGIYDSSSCKCSCLASFRGDECENVECEHLDEDMCEYLECEDAPEVKYYCIHKCNLCDAQSGLSSLSTPFSSTSTSTTTVASVTSTETTSEISTTVSIEKKTCMNEGIFDPSTFECNCLVGFSGAQCENVDCNQQDEGMCEYLECDDAPEIKYYCIQKCGLCTVSSKTPVATSTTTINGKTCLHGGMFDAAFNKCNCLPGFNGDACETVNCSEPDDDVCSMLDCNDSPEVRFYCIHQCNLC